MSYPNKKKNIVTGYLWVILIFYFVFLFSLTFGIGRDAPAFVFSDKELLQYRWENATNLVPFVTINAMLSWEFDYSYVVVNIFGNIAALMPVGVLFPMLFKKARRFVPFTLMTTLLVVFIEITQFVFCVGKLDIDDLILNVFGAIIVYGVYMLYNKKIKQRGN